MRNLECLTFEKFIKEIDKFYFFSYIRGDNFIISNIHETEKTSSLENVT